MIASGDLSKGRQIGRFETRVQLVLIGWQNVLAQSYGTGGCSY